MKRPKEDSLLDDDFDDQFSEYDNSLERRPQELDEGTFDKRNNPKTILKELKMQLLNVYEKEVTKKDEENGEVTITMSIKQIPGTTPLCNKQGVQEIVSYVQNIINGHIVQSNFLDLKDFKDFMLHISQDVTQHFVCKRKDWGLTITQVDILISRVVNIDEGFLRRALYNKERESYGETYKENYNRNTAESPDKNGLLKRFYNAVTRW